MSGKSTAYLLVAPDKANYYRLLFPALHPIYSSDFHIFAIHRTQYGCEEGDLRLVPEPSLSDRWRTASGTTYGVMTAIWAGYTPESTYAEIFGGV